MFDENEWRPEPDGTNCWCWGDYPHQPVDVPYESIAHYATTRIGLCDFHYRQIVGKDPKAADEPKNAASET